VASGVEFLVGLEGPDTLSCLKLCGYSNSARSCCDFCIRLGAYVGVRGFGRD